MRCACNYDGAVAITPHNTEVNRADALWVVGTGNLIVQGEDGNDVTFTAVPANTWLPIRVTRVKATGTTATGIYGFKERQ